MADIAIQEQKITADSTLDQYDQQLTGQVYFAVVLGGGSSTSFGTGGTQIYFQFPPKITGENNESLWLPIDIWAIEPVKIHKGSAGRKLTMEWEYLASSAIWTPTKISQQIRNLKSYFFDFKEETYPLVIVQYTQVIPVHTHFRLMTFADTYSPEIFGFGDNAHPLHTKISCGLELATNIQIGLKGGSTKNVGQETADMKGKEQQTPLTFAVPAWY
jgi:hypothetical protein